MSTWACLIKLVINNNWYNACSQSCKCQSFSSFDRSWLIFTFMKEGANQGHLKDFAHSLQTLHCNDAPRKHLFLKDKTTPFTLIYNENICESLCTLSNEIERYGSNIEHLEIIFRKTFVQNNDRSYINHHYCYL